MFFPVNAKFFTLLEKSFITNALLTFQAARSRIATSDTALFIHFNAIMSLYQKQPWRIFPLNIKYRRNTISCVKAVYRRGKEST